MVGVIDREEALQAAQSRFFCKQREILDGNALDDATFEKSLEFSSRALTEYILYRDMIIQRFQAISATDREDVAHNLIVPRYKRFEHSSLIDGIYSNNAWLLDDKFMTFRTVLSEAKMADVIAAISDSEDASEEEGRPDISLIFSADPLTEARVDVVVVEVKRRLFNEREVSYAPTQLAIRANKLVEHCPSIQRMWYYAIVELTPAFSKVLRTLGWTPLFSRGEVFYHEGRVELDNGRVIPAPMFIMSYDAVIRDAAARNHTFLELLRSDFQASVAARAASELAESIQSKAES